MNPQAKGLSMIVYRAPEGVDPLPALGRGEQVRVPMKGRTCPDCGGTGEHVTTHYSYDGDPPERDVEQCLGDCNGSGLVAPIQPATPCPDCGGKGIGPDHTGYVTTCTYRRQFERSGEILLGWTCPEHLYDCPRVAYVDDGKCQLCDGLGYVGGDLGVITEQENVADETVVGGHWLPVSASTPHDAERRLVVSGYTQVTEALPVVDYDTPPGSVPVPCVVVGAGVVFRFFEKPDDPNRKSIEMLIHEPWAANLTPGMFVLSLRGWTDIDPPITEMECARCDGTTWCTCCGSRAACDRCNPPRSGHVPLSVEPGQVVELP